VSSSSYEDLEDLVKAVDEDGNKITIEEWSERERWHWANKAGDVLISTVFIGLGTELYETMTFGETSVCTEDQFRYDTKEQAVKGHSKVYHEIMGAHILRDKEWRTYESCDMS
jgi:hypothetical protein